MDALLGQIVDYPWGRRSRFHSGGSPSTLYFILLVLARSILPTASAQAPAEPDPDVSLLAASIAEFGAGARPRRSALWHHTEA